MSDPNSPPNKRLLEEHCEEIFQELLATAKKDLDAWPIGGQQEHDIVMSVFRTFIRRDKDRRFSELRDSNDLLNMMLWLITRKIADKRRRHYRRGEGKVICPDILKAKPAPDVDESACRELLDLLDKPPQVADLRKIAVLKLEGYSNEDIASRLKCSEATVRRKITEIRSRWSPENVE